MARDPTFVFEYIKQVESLAADVLCDRRDIIEFNKKRDKTREASRALAKANNADKTWLCCGNLFIKFTNQQAKNILEKDHQQLDSEINKLQTGLKAKVSKLYEAEDKPELKRFNLVPLSKQDKESLNDLIGL